MCVRGLFIFISKHRTCETRYLWTEARSGYGLHCRYLRRRADISCVPVGGYEGAERKRLLMGRTEIIESKVERFTIKQQQQESWEEEYVAALSIEGNFKFDKKKRNHRHVLGSMLGTGIERSTIGDILVPSSSSSSSPSSSSSLSEENFSDFPIVAIVSAELCEYFLSSLTHISRIPVTTERIPLSSIIIPDVVKHVMVKTCASSRLDSMASICFNTSRSKTADSIKRGEVQLNWQVCTKPGSEVKQGDVITVRGKGRAHIEGIEINHRERRVVEFTLFT